MKPVPLPGFSVSSYLACFSLARCLLLSVRNASFHLFQMFTTYFASTIRDLITKAEHFSTTKVSKSESPGANSIFVG